MAVLRNSTFTSLVISLAIAFAALLHFGADTNWDLQNYHFYNPYALLEGRLDRDLFPSLQAYLNPTLDVPFYLAAVHLGSAAANGLLALHLGLFLWIVFLFNRQLLRSALMESSPATVLVLAVAATVIGVTGAAGVGQAITTFNEVPIAALVMVSLTLVLPDAEGRFPGTGRFALAGLLIGVGVGLKLTAATYLLGAGIALVPWSLRRDRVRSLAVYGLTAVGGIFLAHGAWGWVLYRKFGNPVFPFFNAIFRSPWEVPRDFSDTRFFPDTAWGYVTYPLEWAFSLSTEVGEIPIRDPRLALLIVAALVLAAMHLFLWRLGPPILFVLVFAVASYVVWLIRFSILRYGIPLEVLAGTLLVLVVALPLRERVIRPTLGAAMATVVAVALIAVTHWPNWGRIPLSAGYTASMPPIPKRATVLLVDQPISFLVPLIPGGKRRFIGVNPWSTMAGPRRDAAVAALAEARGTVWALVLRTPRASSLVEELGWKIDEPRCATVQTSMTTARIDLCPVTPLGP